MKNYLILIIAVLAGFSAQAQEKYKILYINTPAVTIDGKECKVGDSFDERNSIDWKDERQAMKVAAMSTGRQIVLSARNFNAGGKSLHDYLTGSARLSTRPGATLSVVDLRNFLTDTHYLLDCIEFPAVHPVDADRFYFLSYPLGDETVNKVLACKDGTVIVDRDIWTVDGRAVEQRPMVVSVSYYDTVRGEITLVTDSMTVIPLDSTLDEN